MRERRVMEKTVIVWLVLMILFLVVELLTVGLTSIWLAGGALTALLLSMAGLETGWQIGGFLAISFLLLYFTRPFAVKYINRCHEKTNYECLIGTIVRITEPVNNLEQTGRAVVNGVEWTVRTESDETVLQKDTLAEVVKISGVKLIVIPCKEG